jgi:pantetheine-phosphate adenylyltransferase
MAGRIYTARAGICAETIMKLPLSSRAKQFSAELSQRVPIQHLRDPSLLDELAARWCERQRFWHGPDHLRRMLEEIEAMPAGEERETLALAAIYHDAVYDPRAANNEEASAVLLLRHAAKPDARVVTQAAEIIVASKWSEVPATSIVAKFFAMDSHQLSESCPLHDRLAYERAIFREYQWADWATYRQKRREFLAGWAQKFPQHRRGAAECIEILEGLCPRIGVYPGSFGPFHLGHLSILRQAEEVFDKVIIAVGVNRQKIGAVDSSKSRSAELQERLRFHEVAAFSGLLTRFVETMPLPVKIVRGVRDGTDLEAELRFVRFLNELRPQTGVVWISCEADLQHLSSSAIRELESIEPGAGSRYVPDTAAIYDLVDRPVSSP